MALGDTRAGLGTRVPEVLVLSHRGDDVAGHGGHLPVVVAQRGAGDQPADDAQHEADGLHGGGHRGRRAQRQTLADQTGVKRAVRRVESEWPRGRRAFSDNRVPKVQV